MAILESVDSTLHLVLASVCWYSYRAVTSLQAEIQSKVDRAAIALVICGLISLVSAGPWFSISQHFLSLTAVLLILVVYAAWSLATSEAGIFSGNMSDSMYSAFFRIAWSLAIVAVQFWINCVCEAFQNAVITAELKDENERRQEKQKTRAKASTKQTRKDI